MIPNNQPSVSEETLDGIVIKSFIDSSKGDKSNIDWDTVESFGEEWGRFHHFSDNEIDKIGNDYFDIALNILNKNITALEVGCGSGRWMKFIAPYVKEIHGIDPSDSVYSACKLLEGVSNKVISKAEVDNIPYANESFDFVYSLGVLHHIPDTRMAMLSCIDKLKPEGYFLVYLYYNLDNRSHFFVLIFKLSNVIRQIVSKLPFKIKSFICDLLAIFIYMPLVFISKLFSKLPLLDKLVKYIPLSYYRSQSFNIIRNDALDRFGTPLEQRHSKLQIKNMMESCGLNNIEFSNNEPYWHAIGQKKR